MMTLEEYRDCPRHGPVVATVTYTDHRDVEMGWRWRAHDVVCPHCTRERDAGDLSTGRRFTPSERMASAERRYRALLARLPMNPTMRAVLELHRPVRVEYEPEPVCEGCDAQGHDVERPRWPCTTTLTVEYLIGS